MRNDIVDELEFPFAMNQAERMSPLWTKIREEVEKKLAALRIKNDDETLTEAQTAALRGQIKFAKYLLGLGDDPTPIDE